jgi:hypothetical protein
VVVVFAIIFSNNGQTDFYPNQVENIISNFNQGGYYSNHPYDITIYPDSYPYFFSNNIIYHQPNLGAQPCQTYIFFTVVVVLIKNRVLKITVIIQVQVLT